MTLTYTKYYRFPKTDFMSEPWIQGIWDSFDAIDALMYSQAAANGTTVWLNATQYGPGMTVIDVTDGSTWICTTAHMSAAAPTSFAQDRTTNPSFWTAIMLSIQARGQWLNNTAYNSGDMVYDTTAGRNVQAICVTKHVSNATGTINDDAVYWGFTYNSLAPQTASGIGYNNAVSHLVAINVQTAIDEVSAGSSAPPVMDGIAAAGVLQKLSRGDHVHPTNTSRAPLNSPVFTGTPTAPTPPTSDSTAKLATTAFVQAAVIGGITGGNIPPAGTLVPLVDATPGAVGVSVYYTREDHVHPTDTSRAPLASPAFTGTPIAPTPIAGDNSTKLATTAFSAVNEVRTDIAQALTAAQQVQARQNIYAAPFDALAYNGMQINGSFEVSQEFGLGAGASTSGKYPCDGWVLSFGGTMSITSMAIATGGAAMPSGLPNQLVTLVATAQPTLGATDTASLTHQIEGYRVSRLGWGTANAQPITLCFWTSHVRTGLWSGAVRNINATRSYVFTYNQAVSNVWQFNTVTIPGDTIGTWNIDNTQGLAVAFTIACGATFTAPAANVWYGTNYIAAPGQVNGVGLTTDGFHLAGFMALPGVEAPPSSRASLIMRPYDQELRICQRYYEFLGAFASGSPVIAPGLAISTSSAYIIVPYVAKRAVPTLVARNIPGLGLYNSAGQSNAVGAFGGTFNGGLNSALAYFTGSSGLVAGNATGLVVTAINSGLAVDARL